MRRSPEIMILLGLLILSMIGVLWYVIDRRAKNRAEMEEQAAHARLQTLTNPVELDATTERKTVDFTSGHPVLHDTPASQTAIDSAVQEMNQARETVVFTAAPKATPPPPED